MSLQIIKIKNIPIKLHFTLIIVFFLITWTLASSFMPNFFPNLSVTHYWIMGVVSAVVLFISVLLHELAHSLLSLRYGLKVRQIMLFIFGGVSEIKEEPKDYRKEFKIAVVGPITSFALAAGFFVVWIALLQTMGSIALPTFPDLQNSSSVDVVDPTLNGADRLLGEGSLQLDEDNNFLIFIRAVSGVLLYSTIVNTLLGLFNLLPAFPLDGGRILRATLMRWNKSFDEATRISVKAGIAISYALMAFGFITIFTGSFVGGIWLIIIGWFLQNGAQAYLQQHELTSVLSGVRLKNIMNRQFVGINRKETAGTALRNYFNKYRKSEFPVIDEQRSLVGSISSKQIMNISENQLENTLVEDVMIPVEDLIIMDPEKKADEALKLIATQNKSRIYICSKHLGYIDKVRDNYPEQTTIERKIKNKEELLGIISKTDILNIAAEREEYDKSIKSFLKRS
jgi:Zn-dependent protease/CBS domain-containing protein